MIIGDVGTVSVTKSKKICIKNTTEPIRLKYIDKPTTTKPMPYIPRVFTIKAIIMGKLIKYSTLKIKCVTSENIIIIIICVMLADIKSPI